LDVTIKMRDVTGHFHYDVTMKLPLTQGGLGVGQLALGHFQLPPLFSYSRGVYWGWVNSPFLWKILRGDIGAIY